MKGQMARTRPRWSRSFALVNQPSGFRFKRIHHKAIQSQISNQREPIVRAECHRVGMRTILTHRVGTLAFVLTLVDQAAHRSVCLKLHKADITAVISRHNGKATASVELDMRRRRANCNLTIQFAQLAHGVDIKCDDLADSLPFLGRFGNGVNLAVLCIYAKKGRVLQPGGLIQKTNLPIDRIHFIYINSRIACFGVRSYK
ncbi:hypothetical protein D3C74_343280 [compost metagenome]